MKKRVLVVGAVIVCALIGAFIRFCIVAGNSVGAGGGIDSPDKKFIAEAMSFEGEKLDLRWSKERKVREMI